MNPFCSLLSVAILLLSSSVLWAQSRVGDPAPVVFWNRQITVLRAYYEQVSPAERAARAVERLNALPNASEWNVVASEISSGNVTGALITVNGHLAIAILPDDLDRESGENLKTAADNAAAQLRSALAARSEQRRLPVLLRGFALSIAATILLLIGLWIIIRIGRRMLAQVDQLASARWRPKLGGFDLQPFVHSINRNLVKLTGLAAVVVMVYVWLTFVLLRFPYSQPSGQRLGSFLINLFAMLGRGVVNSLPGLFTVLVIFLLARIAVRVLNGVVGQVERGQLDLPWLDRDTARATRRLVAVIIWIFALIIAYPFIPGSGTDVFKGIGVLVGLMISFGSAGLINQMMSGLVVIYSRALKPGEFVRIGDEDYGVVTEVGLLSTKLLTRKREEITVPNAVLIGAKTVNYSRHAAAAGSDVGTTLTIGYNTPWRQVHAMLLQAADQTAGIRKDPAPRVWQKALSDFYVEYELVFSLDRPEDRVPILSELHKNIQDAFNEQGVQIMSPHFEAQPDEKVFVPKSNWFVPTAEK